MKREDLAWLLSMTNDMRAAKKDDLLDDLPLSDPEQSMSCLVANAFNYGCEVDPRTNGDLGYIYFKSIEDVETYIGIVGEQYRKDEYSAFLTQELNDVAVGFDRGLYGEYDSGYWETEESQVHQ